MSIINHTNPNLTKQNSRRYKWFFNLVFLMILIIILIIIYRFINIHYFKVIKPSPLPPVPVAISTTQNLDIPVVYTELGTVIPITTVTVPARISGYLQKIYFSEGQYVRKGDLLALIDPRPYEAQKAQYEGTLKADQALLQQAKVDNARYQQLLKKQSIAPMVAQDQQYKVAQLEGQVKADQALVQQQKLNIDYCHIKASVDGRIGIRQVDVGNYVTEGQNGGIAILTQMDPISVIFTIPENKLSEIRNSIEKYKTLHIEAWNNDNTKKLALGTASILDSQIDTSTGTVKLRAIFPNHHSTLFPNQFVNVHVLVDTLHNVLAVPNNAIQTGPNGSFVYTVKEDSTVKLNLVKTGYNNGEMTVIVTGLNQKDKVVTDGIDQLKNGSKIYIPQNTSNSSI